MTIASSPISTPAPVDDGVGAASDLGTCPPDGYHYVHEMVWLVARWGEQGLLPRDLGFVHPRFRRP